MSCTINLHADNEKHYKCGTIAIGDTVFYYSYSTIVALHRQEYKVRRRNHWGPTTGKHMKHLGCYDFKEISDDGFEAMKQKTIKDTVLCQI